MPTVRENEDAAAREAHRKMTLDELKRERDRVADIIANEKTKPNEYFQREEERIRKEIARRAGNENA